MRVMIDTNVLISALLFPSKRMNLLMHTITSKYQLVLSSYIERSISTKSGRSFCTISQTRMRFTPS